MAKRKSIYERVFNMTDKAFLKFILIVLMLSLIQMAFVLGYTVASRTLKVEMPLKERMLPLIKTGL